MTRLTGFISLLLVLTAVYACDSDKKGCPEGQTECNDGECHECCIDDDCPGMTDCSEAYIICNDDYECECVCYKDGEDCSRDPDICCSGLYCDIFTDTCMPECIPCISDYDCPDDLVCSCQFPWEEDCCCKERQPCNTDADCAPGEYCYNGRCMKMGDCDLHECVVLPAQAVVREGTTAQFGATPYLTSGAVAPGYPFSWSSSDTEVAEVVDGLVTGGASTGPATITATPVACMVTCTAEVYNYGPVTSGHTRVVVVDELTREPVMGATVVIESEAPAATNELGFVEVAMELGEANPGDITISKLDYHYVTLKSVKTSDVIVYLNPLYHLDFSQDPPVKQAGGIKGKFDFGMIRCEPPMSTCDVAFGLAGLTLPPNLTNLRLDALTGLEFDPRVVLANCTEQFPISTATVLLATTDCQKEYFTPLAAPGNRIAWGFGGKIDLMAFIDALGPVLAGGDAGARDMVLGLMPFFSSFYTSMIPNVDIAPRPMVADINDIDGDPDTTALPDFDNFPPQDMTLKVGADQQMSFQTPALPVGDYDGVVLIGGLIVNGAGFVPLGMALGKDSKGSNDPPDGVIEDPIVLTVAEVAGRIPEGQFHRIVLALAEKLADGAEPSGRAVQILFVDSFTGTHTLPAFLTPPEVTYDQQTRSLEIVQVPDGTDFLQMSFVGENDSGWHVLTEDFSSVNLPAAPPEGDRAELVGVYAVSLEAGNYQDLVEFNDVNLGNLIEAVNSFSVRE